MNIMKSRVAAVAVGAAVLVTLGGVGGAVAGSLITTYDIKDYTIRGVDMRANSITSAKVKDGSIYSNDIHDGTVTQADLAFNIPTARGVVEVTDSQKIATIGNDTDIDLYCPSGKVVLRVNGGLSWVTSDKGTVTKHSESPWEGGTSAAQNKIDGAYYGVETITADSDTADTTITAHILCG